MCQRCAFHHSRVRSGAFSQSAPRRFFARFLRTCCEQQEKRKKQRARSMMKEASSRLARLVGSRRLAQGRRRRSDERERSKKKNPIILCLVFEHLKKISQVISKFNLMLPRQEEQVGGKSSLVPYIPGPQKGGGGGVLTPVADEKKKT